MTKLSLYFNTAIFDDSLHGRDPNSVSNFFHPGFFPVCYDSSNLSNIDKLLITIKSLKAIKFNTAVFNISVETDKFFTEIQKAINESINAENIIINPYRPSTKNEWINDINTNYELFNDDPVVVVMNHDHPLNPKYLSNFFNDVNDVFSDVTSRHPLLSYSHAPEMLLEYKHLDKTGLKYKKAKIFWLDSLYLMRISTLKLAFERLSVPSEDFYLGRIDWPGVYINGLDVIFYYSQIPYFYHLDGYQHFNGINLSSFLQIHQEYLEKIDSENYVYFSEWISHYYIWLSSKFSYKHPYKFKMYLSNTFSHYFSFARNREGLPFTLFQKQLLIASVFSLFNDLSQLFFVEQVISKQSKSLSKYLPFKYLVILKRIFKR